MNPVVTALAEDWFNANTFATNTAWPQDLTLLIVFAAYKLCFIDVAGALLPFYYYSRL